MDLKPEWEAWDRQGESVVFTNGCFDLLHWGHVAYLEEARCHGTYLVVGLNSDASVRHLKGPTRPVVTFEQRAFVLSGLRAVDLVVGFGEETPASLIENVQPDVLVKGGDWKVSEIVGADTVLARGGKVKSLKFVEGASSTGLIETVLGRQDGF